jgi:hypothetical protein
MRVFGKAAAIGLTYLTAILLLFAGLPRFECRCPNGYIKLFCFGSVSPVSGNSCCRDHGARNTGPAKQISCCGHCHGGSQSGPSPCNSQLQAPGCQKMLVQAEVFASASGKTLAPADYLSVPHALLLALPTATQHPIFGPFHLLTPPTDLTVFLQRLLI